MLFSLLQSFSQNNFRSTLIMILLTIPIVLLALSAHESAHGWVAYKCGDPTARNLGRISLNPMKHFDPMGFLCMFLFGFGWANPVPINSRNFKNSKWGTVITAAAGPLTNFVIGLVSVVFSVLTSLFFYLLLAKANVSAYATELPFYLYLIQALYFFFYLCSVMNFTLCFFNLIPVPPFDGSRIFFSFLPANLYFRIMKYERQIMLGVLLFFFVVSRFFSFSPSTWLANQLYDLLYTPFFKFFSLFFR